MQLPFYKKLTRRNLVARTALVSVSAIFLSVFEMEELFWGVHTNALWTILFLCPLVLVSAPLFFQALDDVRRKKLSVELLSAFGSGFAFVSGIVYEFSGSPNAPLFHFWLFSLVICLSILGKTLETLVERHARETVVRLRNFTPRSAHVYKNGQVVETPISQIAVGDVLQILGEETFPADGVLVHGRTSVDESILTGESLPIEKKNGDRVTGGTKNLYAVVRMKVESLGEKTVLAQVAQLVENAQKAQLPVLRETEPVVRKLVPLVLTVTPVAAAIELFWTGSWGGASVVATAVLLSASPTAWAMAAPSAVAFAANRALKSGILFKDAQALEEAGKTQAFFWDKTGTLTQGAPVLTAFEAFGEYNYLQLLTWSASTEKNSVHPLAKAVIERTLQEKLPILEASEVEDVPGFGRKAIVDGRRIVLGTLDFCLTELVPDPETQEVPPWPKAVYLDRWVQEGRTLLYVAIDGKPGGMLACEDPIRNESFEAVRRLAAMGVQQSMITGDLDSPAKTVARKLRIPQWRSRILPAEKATIVRDASISGLKTAFAGDGVNDAPALAVADLGIAMGSGTELAQKSSAMVLLRNSPLDAVIALELSRATRLKVLGNLSLCRMSTFVTMAASLGLHWLFQIPGLWPSAIGLIVGPLAVASSSLALLRFRSLVSPDRDILPEVPFEDESGKEAAMVKKVHIQGMACGHCAVRIEKALSTLPGVSQVKVNLAGQFAEVETTAELDEASVQAAIDNAGYQLGKIV